jgi:hypothetical protein
VVLTVAVNIGTVTIGDIYIGTSKLTKGTDYTESDGEITIKKEKVDDLEVGDHVIKVETDQGDVTAVLTVENTTALEIEPETATFDLNPGGANNGNLEFEIKHNTTSVSLMAVYIGEDTLTPETHYTTDDLVITILKTYLATLDKGAVTITFKTDKGDVDAVITIEDTTVVG